MAAKLTDAAGEESTLPKSEVATDIQEESVPQDPAPPSAAIDGQKWPGWPGDNVYRMIVPVTKVGSIIGRKGELIKKLCEETRARVRILDGPVGPTDRIVLISGKEEPDTEISPAMDAVLRIFKHISGISENGDVSMAPPECSVRLLVASSQAISLIGKHGTLIKSIQESTGATIRVLTGGELPFYPTMEERVVDIQGEPLKALKAVEAAIGHIRKFLVDRSVISFYEKSLHTPATQEYPADTWKDKAQSLLHNANQTSIGSEHVLPMRHDSLYLDREPPLNSHGQRIGLSLYGQDPTFSDMRNSGFGRVSDAFVTKVTQTMQVPLAYAEDIIGVEGRNIEYIRRSSGAAITVMESRGIPDEITVEIKGTSTQVQSAQNLVQDYLAQHKEPVPRIHERGLAAGFSSSYSHFPTTGYGGSYSGGYGGPYGGYGGSYGGYDDYRF